MRQKYFANGRGALMNISRFADIGHATISRGRVDLSIPILFQKMYFSKSFGYALRGILYVAMMNDENRKIPIEEIASRLNVPRHFLGKILRSIVKHGILSSTKGPHGGFFINENTMSTRLLTLVLLIEGPQFEDCALHFRKCNAANPCPLHYKVEELRRSLKEVIGDTTIADMVAKEKPEFIRSISATLPV